MEDTIEYITVGEFIEILSNFDEDRQVHINNIGEFNIKENNRGIDICNVAHEHWDDDTWDLTDLDTNDTWYSDTDWYCDTEDFNYINEETCDDDFKISLKYGDVL